MKKRYWIAPVALAAIAGAGAVWAASISNINGQSCGDFTGTWHFVNNKTGGAPAGTLTAFWDSGDTCTVSPSKVTASTQHFNCVASGALTSAVTNLPGRLVLSNFACETKKCDPKTEKCG